MTNSSRQVIPKRARRGEVSKPEWVVAPIGVNGFRLHMY